MALRARARVLLAAAGKDQGPNPEKASSLFENVRKRVTTGKLLRPDVVDDTLRLPVGESKFRFPSPGFSSDVASSAVGNIVPVGGNRTALQLQYRHKENPDDELTGIDAILLLSVMNSSQPPPVVPQGPYKNVFDISYYSRDSRRRMMKEEVEPAVAAKDDLPPTPGSPLTVTYLGVAGDFDIAK